MRGYNRAIIMGNVARDPEIRYTASQKAVASFSVAVNRSWKDANGELREEVAFIPVVVWGKAAENCERYLRKGSGVLVDGRINTRNYESKTGEKRYVTEIVAETVQFVGPRRDDNGGSYQGSSSYGGQDRGNRSFGGGSYQGGGYQPRDTGAAPKSYRDSQPQSQPQQQSGGFGGGDAFPMDISELDPVSAPAPQSEDEADIPF
ncbi:MAG: single-stranded DNA-binding protein [Pyramidobacter sp.]|nr:single-stranded DNA-binding protein [Pyramidobacter sp.]